MKRRERVCFSEEAFEDADFEADDEDADDEDADDEDAADEDADDEDAADEDAAEDEDVDDEDADDEVADDEDAGAVPSVGVSAFQMRTVAASTEPKSLWTLSGKACAGISHMDKDECFSVVNKYNKRWTRNPKLRTIPDKYQDYRPEGCYRYKGKVWFNPNHNKSASEKVWTRGRRTICLAERFNLMSGDVCFDNTVPTQFGLQDRCKSAAQLVNKYKKLYMVPKKWQSRRPAGCYKFKGAVWWNAKEGLQGETITMKGRERVCFSEEADDEEADFEAAADDEDVDDEDVDDEDVDDENVDDGDADDEDADDEDADDEVADDEDADDEDADEEAADDKDSNDGDAEEVPSAGKKDADGKHW